MANTAVFDATLRISGPNAGPLVRVLSELISTTGLLFDAEIALPNAATTLAALLGTGVNLANATAVIFIPDATATGTIYWDSTGTGTLSVVSAAPNPVILPAGAAVAGTAKIWASAALNGELIIF